VNLHLNKERNPEHGGDLELSNAGVTRSAEKIKRNTNPDQSAGKVLALGDRYLRRRRWGR